MAISKSLLFHFFLHVIECVKPGNLLDDLDWVRRRFWREENTLENHGKQRDTPK